MGGRLTSVRVVVALSTAALVLALQATPAGAVPTVVVEPSTGLVDGQSVTVLGSGFVPNRSLAAAQCGPGGEATIDDCDTRATADAVSDADGSFTVSFTVRRFIETPVDGEVDCAAPPVDTCSIGVVQDDLTAGGPTAFDPDVAAEPRLAVTAEPISATVQGRVVRLQGVVRCNRPSRAFVLGQLRQVVGRATTDGYFYADVACDGQAPFSAVIEGSPGEWRRGAAELRLTGGGSDDDDQFDDFVVERFIRLEPK